MNPIEVLFIFDSKLSLFSQTDSHPTGVELFDHLAAQKDLATLRQRHWFGLLKSSASSTPGSTPDSSSDPKDHSEVIEERKGSDPSVAAPSSSGAFLGDTVDLGWPLEHQRLQRIKVLIAWEKVGMIEETV